MSLGANKYGKAENRIVRIVRDTVRHEIVDLNVTSQLRGARLIDSYLAGATHVTGGVKDLVVLKSSGSEFAGFPRDKYTTLVETDDRIMATSVTGRWRFLPAAVEAGIDYNGLYAEVTQVLLSTFAKVYSLALQQTLFEMGKAVTGPAGPLVVFVYSVLLRLRSMRRRACRSARPLNRRRHSPG